MVKKILSLVLAAGILGSCCGCMRKKVGIRLVEKVCVQWEEDGQTVCREHENPETIQLILNQVRTLGQRFSSQTNPDTLNTPTVTVKLLFSDGSEKQYQLKSDRYVRVGQAPWQQVNPQKVASLQLLLLSLSENSRT